MSTLSLCLSALTQMLCTFILLRLTHPPPHTQDGGAGRTFASGQPSLDAVRAAQAEKLRVLAEQQEARLAAAKAEEEQ